MKFGDKVIARGSLRRTEDYVPHGMNRAYWVPVVWKTPQSGILIGWRHLSDGEVDVSYDEGSQYYPKKHFKVGLVVFNERQNPRYIPMNMLHDVGE